MPARRGQAPAAAHRLVADLAGLLLLLLAVMSAVEAQTPVRVGVYQNPPKVFIDTDGMAAGFFVDVIDAIAARAGWLPHYLPCEWQRCLADVAAGRLDLMVDVAESSERQGRLRFGREAVLSSWSELYRARGGALHTILDTDRRRIGVLAAGIQGPALLAEAALCDITPRLATFGSFEAAFSALDADPRLLDSTDVHLRALKAELAPSVVWRCYAWTSDRFKNVNESLGHAAGDQVLVQVAERLLAGREPGELVARLGADEFALLLPGSHDTDALARKARSVMTALALPLRLDAQTFSLSASIGIARLPEDAADAGGLLMHADAAVGRAKREGRGQFAFSAPALTEQAHARMRLENRLRHALTAREFSLACQPQMDLDTGRVTGIEALLRWTPVDGEALSPAHFIPIAEAMGLMPELGAWVLDEAIGQARVWRDAGLEFGRMAVNVSTSQLCHADFSATVQGALQAHGLTAGCLELEITEGVLDTRFEGLSTHLDELRELAVSLAIDDFGTGYSSLARLRRLPVAVLELDKSFVDGLPESGEDLAVAHTVLALASALSLQVVAEGVERERQGEALRAIGCRCAQGYLYSQPLEAAAATVWLQAGAARSD